MQAKVTSRGVLIPKAYFPGVKEVEIRKGKEGILVVPMVADDPIHFMGATPIDDEITDAAANHDRYLYKK